MPRLRLIVVLLALVPPAWSQNPGGFTPGAAGLGDPLYPLAGNGGYDVEHYALTLDYQPATNHLVGTAEIRARATQGLSRFDLDLRGFALTRLLVDGRAASFTRSGQELVVTPRKGIPAGKAFTVIIDYAGTPEVVTDPDASIEGWIPTRDGAFVVGEPQGSPAWYPVNDNPRDKASYDFRVTVPAGLTVMANGVLVSSATSGGRTTWVWHAAEPMAPYLSTVTLGVFDLSVTTLAGGTPSYVAVDPQLGSTAVLAKLPDILAFYSSIYGPYPFAAAGAIVDDARFVGYALETQTKPVFDRMPDEATLAHELSHQWFGDSVTLIQWPDLWLHEGFATWSEWIWSEHNGGQSAQGFFDQLYSRSGSVDAFWNPPPGNPGSPALLFSASVYLRGGMTLQALRQRVGDPTFFRILSDWAAENRHGNVDTPRFIALAERDAGLSLAHFFDVWLYQLGKPVGW
ncbi:MAG: M1 family peptidase [Planctomycetes bacterium]|nr:M1 family peptidase [Planctomycetota bacterium]